MARKINDFIISIGIDAKDAEKVIKELEKRIYAISKTKAQLAKASHQEEKAALTTKREAVKLETDLIKKEERRYALLSRIANFHKKLTPKQEKPLDVDAFTTKKHKAAGSLQTAATGLERIAQDKGMMAKLKRETDLTDESMRSLINKVNKLEGQMRNASNPEELKKLQTEYAILGKEIKTVRGDATLLRGKFTLLEKAQGSLKRSVGNLARAYISLYAVMRGGQAAFRVLDQLESVQATMLSSSETAQEAAEKYEWVKQSAMELGTPLAETAGGYAKIAAAGKEANLTAQQSKEVFLAAQEASVAFGLSADDTGGVMRAFTQILGKKQVMMEELKLQLADRLPVVMGVFADSMNVTTSELYDMIAAGEVGTEQFLQFTGALRENVTESGALQAGLGTIGRSWQRFVNTIQMSIESIYGGGFRNLGLELLGDLGEVVKDITPYLKAYVEGLVLVGKFLKAVIIDPLVWFVDIFAKGISDILGFFYHLLGEEDSAVNGIDRMTDAFTILGLELDYILARMSQIKAATVDTAKTLVTDVLDKYDLFGAKGETFQPLIQAALDRGEGEYGVRKVMEGAYTQEQIDDYIEDLRSGGLIGNSILPTSQSALQSMQGDLARLQVSIDSNVLKAVIQEGIDLVYEESLLSSIDAR